MLYVTVLMLLLEICTQCITGVYMTCPPYSSVHVVALGRVPSCELLFEIVTLTMAHKPIREVNLQIRDVLRSSI